MDSRVARVRLATYRRSRESWVKWFRHTPTHVFLRRDEALSNGFIFCFQRAFGSRNYIRIHVREAIVFEVFPTISASMNI